MLFLSAIRVFILPMEESPKYVRLVSIHCLGTDNAYVLQIPRIDWSRRGGCRSHPSSRRCQRQDLYLDGRGSTQRCEALLQGRRRWRTSDDQILNVGTRQELVQGSRESRRRIERGRD